MKVENVVCFKNSDGFITESDVIAKRRQRVLNKKGKGKYAEEVLFGGHWLYTSDLKKASRTPEQIKIDKQKDALRILDNENKCRSCDGRGTHTEDDYCGRYDVGCSTCSGTGFTIEYRKDNPNRIFSRR